MKNVLQTYLQYSKRIAIFGIVQWAVAAVIVAAIVCIAVFTHNVLYENEAMILKNIITSSSALAMAISGGYYAHSAYDNNLKQKISSEQHTQESSTNG